ncbi:MAG: T6SS phospholipase effector Tle1-like catalytic domain-containing protein [Iodobacter sp.]
MTKRCNRFNEKMADLCNRKSFFSGDEENILIEFEKRELPPIGKPEASCTTNLFLGFFFDGTRNNYRQAFDEGTEDFSNVARLYDSFPGMSVPGVLPASAEWQHEKEAFKHFFKVYVPGVGSAFEQVGDKGGGTLGAAAALYGEIRIVWGLAQAMNCLNRFFTGQLLINDSEIKDLTKKIKITQWELRRKVADSRPDDQGRSEESSVQILNSLLKRLHTSLDLHMRKGSTNKPAKTDPGIVDTLHFSCFGFSRGATEARVFFNWLRLLCQLDSELCEKPGQLTLAGFPVQFDFLGLFDTVASVGLASSSVLWDGHGGWADAEWSLRVHPEVECLHLVAAHEARRSFPLDSIQVGGSLLSGKHAEIMLPGVHSDVGGGYSPKTQGRGNSPVGADMLSRIPLAMMYRKARLSGVPLKAEVANADAKYRFEIDAALITAFNAYLEACPLQSGSYKELLHDQYLPYIAWRLSWLDKQDSASLRCLFP